MEELPEVTRFELIDNHGRAHGYYDVEAFAYSVQDDGKTFKVFVNTDVGRRATRVVREAE